MHRITRLILIVASILATAPFAVADARKSKPGQTTAGSNKDNARGKLCGPRAVHYHDHQGCIAYQARLGWDSATASRFCGARCRG